LYLLNFICPDVSENKYTLYEVCLSFANLLCFQRGVSYSSMIFNVVLNNIKNVRNDRVKFKIVLCKYGLLIHFVHLHSSLSIIQIIHIIDILKFKQVFNF
jgi:hypothetical protein